jgi:rare lipoprotein A
MADSGYAESLAHGCFPGLYCGMVGRYPRFLGDFFPKTRLLPAFLLIFLPGCADFQRSSGPALYEARPVSTEIGKASFYGGRDIGRLTANGERYHVSNCTAAHKRLPFNTMVRVTNLRNGKSVLVRINDRGPFVKGRIIDLTVVAARKIEMISDGVVPVRVEVLKPIEVIRKPNRQGPGME